MKLKNILFISFFALMTLVSCKQVGGDYPGTEYMPDMGHSIAYEANYYDYYYYNTWGTEAAYYQYAQPRLPVAKTIARGDAGIAVGDQMREKAMVGLPKAGSVPYSYGDTDEERERASREIISNPYPITESGLAIGKNLYDINCGICHGTKGDGEGYLVSEKNKHAVYGAQPAILTSDDFINASNGQLYHAIVYGKNVMGGYTDKLSYQERWQVIHYIRSLQAKAKGLVYNEQANTLDKVSLPLIAWNAAHGVVNAEQIDMRRHDVESGHDDHH